MGFLFFWLCRSCSNFQLSTCTFNSPLDVTKALFHTFTVNAVFSLEDSAEFALRQFSVAQPLTMAMNGNFDVQEMLDFCVRFRDQQKLKRDRPHWYVLERWNKEQWWYDRKGRHYYESSSVSYYWSPALHYQEIRGDYTQRRIRNELLLLDEMMSQ